MLPQRHPFADLLIRHSHELVKHSGVGETLTALWGKYWILKGRQTVKRVIHSCTICLKHEGPSHLYPNPPDLSSDCVSDDLPISHTEIDSLDL